MIYAHTRYRKTPTTIESTQQKKIFTARPLFHFPSEGAVSHIWKDGDRLDILAHEYYGSSQLWWVILDTNSKYKWEGEISVGDILVIPSIERVVDRI